MTGALFSLLKKFETLECRNRSFLCVLDFPGAVRAQGFLSLVVVSTRGWREGVGEQQPPKYSKNRPPELCSPTHTRGHRKKVAKKKA